MVQQLFSRVTKGHQSFSENQALESQLSHMLSRNLVGRSWQTTQQPWMSRAGSGRALLYQASGAKDQRSKISMASALWSFLLGLGVQSRWSLCSNYSQLQPVCWISRRNRGPKRFS